MIKLTTFHSLTLAAALIFAGSAAAQTVGNTPCGVERDVEAGLLSPDMYERLTDAFELIGEEQYAEAYEELSDLRDRRMTEFETATVEQALGFSAAQLERYPAAIEHLREAIRMDLMPNTQHFEMILQVAQLLHAVEDYDEALRQLDYWFCVSTEDRQACIFSRKIIVRHWRRLIRRSRSVKIRRKTGTASSWRCISSCRSLRQLSTH